jgi:eukaryotic-like serine/threonine-protein kinase
MDAERWQRIKDAFSAALDLPSEERAEWLSFTLPDDPSLAREVKELLAAHDAAGDFYEQGALAAVPAVQQRLEGAVEGMRVGPYRVLSELGHGGMGAVYLAVRDEPKFTQKVALKLIKRGMDTDEIVRRFVAERQILASLAHPNIARLFDGGSTPDGRPYFVMEYVEGQPITAYAGERKLSVEERLRLFLRVCRAVQSAHQSLVVHRDLKPANILVDAEGEPKLLDFGIAKLLDPSSFGGMTALTGLAPGPMTPDYASPEQLAGGPVTTATDVYGLGLLLYELLVGLNPRAVERKLGEGWSDRPPSQAILALAEPGDTEARRLARRVSGDLDTIVGKALEREPERRYGTAAALADDVERHLTQRPVTARRPTVGYRLSRTLIRHKLASALGVAVFLFAVIASCLALAWRQERDLAKAQRQIAQALNDLQLRMIERAGPDQNRGETLTVRQVLDDESQELLREDSRYPPEIRAALLEAIGTTYWKLGLYAQAQTNLERARQLREPFRNSSPNAALALAGTLDAMGQVSFDQEAYAESRKFFQRALTFKEHWLEKDALPLAEDLSGLGTISINEGNLEDADQKFHRACDISRREGRPKDLGDCYANLGSLAELRAEYPKALFDLSLALGYFRSTLGEDDSDTLNVKRNLASVLVKTADYAKAEILLREIADVRRRLLKPNHPDLAQSLLDLGIAQQEGGHLVAAQATLDELLRMRRSYRFPHDQSEAETWNLQGSLAYEFKDLDAADAAYARSYALYRELPGNQRTPLSNILNSRALVRLLRGDPASALGMARESLELAQAGAKSSEAVALAEKVLGRSYLDLGQRARARAFLEHSYKTLLRLHGPKHPDTREAAEYLHRLGVPGG